jgi:hypothetical protein
MSLKPEVCNLHVVGVYSKSDSIDVKEEEVALKSLC